MSELVPSGLEERRVEDWERRCRTIREVRREVRRVDPAELMDWTEVVGTAMRVSGGGGRRE